MKIVKNILAVVLGWLLGSFVNGGLVEIGHTVFPIEGLDTQNFEALKLAVAEFEAHHFLFPFLAHALGTLVGAAIASLLAVGNKRNYALVVGALFLLGGIIMNFFLLPGPIWFSALDILVAYIPMALIGAQIGIKLSKKVNN